MRYVKFNKNSFDILGGKEYNIEFETDNEFCVIDEGGEIQTYFKQGFEIKDKPVMVKSKVGIEYELIKKLEQRIEKLEQIINNK